jgi:CRP-like cAMP-binding protein
LRGWEIFSHFSDEQLAQLARCVTRNRFPAGATILREGEPTLDAYLIQSGRVRIQRQTSYGLFTLASLGPGHLFGETAFVDRTPRSGDAVTTRETEVLTFNPIALSTLMERDARFNLSLFWLFWKSLSAKLRQTNHNLTHFFSETGRPPEAPEESGGTDAGFRVDLAAKRKLFQEQKLSPMEIHFLSTLSRERRYAPNQVIFREGEKAEEMFILLEGRVMISKYIPGAGEEALAFLERGSYFGEMALIDNEPRSADAKAHDAGAVVLALSREVTEGILDIHRVSSIRLLTLLCNLVASRLRELDDKVIGWFIIAGGHVSWPVEPD